jgi:hypothetical protein
LKQVVDDSFRCPFQTAVPQKSEGRPGSPGGGLHSNSNFWERSVPDALSSGTNAANACFDAESFSAGPLSSVAGIMG